MRSTMMLVDVQNEVREWVAVNFPNTNAVEQLLGVVEEMGELSHAVLKMRQGIRGDKDELRAEMVDAVGDIMIYLLSFCNFANINLEGTTFDVWEKVQKRDWVKNPKDGS